MAVVAKLQRNRPAPAPTSAPGTPRGSVQRALLTWYDRERREMPWRARPGEPIDPYRVWLSEVMLQQTTVKTVTPYFERFVVRWPDFAALAAADREDVLASWAGLGYYSRARNLHECARVVVAEHDSRLPADETALRAPRGIGPYTAAAIAAIAFGQPATPVDGNVERVIARLFAVETPMPAAKLEIRHLAATLTPAKRPGDWVQAVMDLGATICAPKRPSCLMCPLALHCRARAAGREADLPQRSVKPVRPVRCGIAFLVLRDDGHVLLRQRPETGLLAAMLEVPSTAWRTDSIGKDDALREAPVAADWWPVPGVVAHVFTHFRLELVVYRAIVPVSSQLTFWADAGRCRWVPRRDLDQQALPSVMRKIITHALKS